ncbi:MAG: hypothetical protein AB1757_15705 [Acidobacteriota bacterium]
MSQIIKTINCLETINSAELVYARQASPAFNFRLNESLNRISEAVYLALGENLIALILGGGYGRGEGGVVYKDGIEQPYNDLDLVLVVKEKTRIDYKALHRISEKYAKNLGIHVDFSRPLDLKDIQHLPNCLMWQDLLNGHIVIQGDKNILNDYAPETLKDKLPVIEASRLLLNRGAGLLWAMRIARKVESGQDSDFIRRNYYKCALALGDALLITYRQYQTAYRGRNQLLANLAKENAEVAAMNLTGLYNKALIFKFSPDDISNTTIDEFRLQVLAENWGIVYLHIESYRTRQKFNSLDEYANWIGIREPQQNTFKYALRNFIRNLQIKKLSLSYPREALFRTLPILLGVCHSTVKDWDTESAKFIEVWRRFN